MSHGALTLVRELASRVKLKGRWCPMAEFRCACGKAVMLARSTSLRDCGCGSYTPPTREAHGGSNLASYRVWLDMKRRCDNADNPRYGGRGIDVCPRWRESFAAFLSDMGPRPFDGATLDRIDNARGYEPGNVRWATMTEQNRNKDNNRRVTALGETKCVVEWSERFGVNAATIRARLDAGWPPDSAVSTPAVAR